MKDFQGHLFISTVLLVILTDEDFSFPTKTSFQRKFLNQVNPNRTGLFLTSSGLGGGDAAPLLSSLFVALSQQNFVRGLTIKALAQIWKKLA